MLAALAGFIAYRSFKAGAPPTPDMAIEEAKRTKEAIEHPELETYVAPGRGGQEVAMPTRSPEEIQHSIERTRRELATSVEELRTKVKVLTDWRRQINEHRTAAIAGAAVLGFVVGGGFAAFRRRR